MRFNFLKDSARFRELELGDVLNREQLSALVLLGQGNEFQDV